MEKKNKTLRSRLKTVAVGLAALVVGAGVVGAALYPRIPRTLEGKIIDANTPGCVRVWDKGYDVDCRLIVQTDNGEYVELLIKMDEYLHPRPADCGTYHDGPKCGIFAGPYAGEEKAEAQLKHNKEAVRKMGQNLQPGRHLKMMVVPSLDNLLSYDPLGMDTYSYKLGTTYRSGE